MDNSKIEALANMLRELDLERNDKETVRYVLDFIANELVNMIG